ncbi:unnamed protein product [Rhizoctonia solani]|uniref:Transmembrane protein n=1 Tax=Rhizoctonia solani TaxID=456999 RepID=A0A8H2X274_9AGAM|nr:unnamed protein product [Rhizoctonia solani]
MQTTVTYALETSADFVGQYYGPRLDLLNVLNAAPTDYRKVVLAAIGVISTDTVTIFRKPQPTIPNPPLSMRIVFNIDDNSPELIPVTSMLTYANGTQVSQFPPAAMIYVDTIYNLAVVTVDAVNLDLGNYKFSNIYRNATRASSGAIVPNLAPTGIDPTNWALPGQDYYNGNISAPYQTWAQSLLAGNPVRLGEVTGLPKEYVMTTSYLCPSYRVKPLRSLLASVFVGSATMTLSVWGAWMVFTTYLARQISAPQVICHCKHCEARRQREAEEAANPPPPGVFTKLMAHITRRRSPEPVDEETAGIKVQPLEWAPQSGHLTVAQRPSYVSSTTGEKN